MAHVLHNNRLKFPKTIFSIVLCTNMAVVTSGETMCTLCFCLADPSLQREIPLIQFSCTLEVYLLSPRSPLLSLCFLIEALTRRKRKILIMAETNCSLLPKLFSAQKDLKCPCDISSILKVCFLNTWLAKFWASIFIQRPFTLSVSFGFHGPPLLTFKTDRLDFRGLDPGKSDVKGSLA